MSAEAQPITPSAFAASLSSLTIDVLHAKAAEIKNSIVHLKHSNEQMLPFADEGDQDCKDALYENLVVLTKMNERIQMLRSEVEKRGMRWSEAEDEDAAAASNATAVATPNGTPETTRTGADGLQSTTNGQTHQDASRERERDQEPRTNGRLTDAELQAQLQTRIDRLEAENGDGVHL